MYLVWLMIAVILIITGIANHEGYPTPSTSEINRYKTQALIFNAVEVCEGDKMCIDNAINATYK